MVHEAVDNYIVPHLQTLVSETGKLSSSLAKVCDGGHGQRLASLGTAKARFADTVRAWAGVSFLRFGPMAAEGGIERFAFWPDKRGIMYRQLPGVLAKRDTELLKPGELGKHSAAIQGLHTLEYLLTDTKQPVTGASEAEIYRCQFAVAIGNNLHALSQSWLTAWTRENGWRFKIYTPGSDNPLYAEPADGARDLLRSLVTGLQIALEQQVQPRLDTMMGVKRTPRLPFISSGNSVEFLNANVIALDVFCRTLGITSYGKGRRIWMPGWIDRAFHFMRRDAPDIPMDPELPDDPEAIDKQGPVITRVRQMRFHLNGIKNIIQRELAPAAGLAVGFNELDGD